MMTSIIDKNGMFCFLDNESLKKIDSMYSITINNPELAFVQLSIALGKNIAEDYVGADLKGYPLYGQDLSSVNLNGADLSNSDLRRAKGYNQPRVTLDGAMLDSDDKDEKNEKVSLHSSGLRSNEENYKIKRKELIWKIASDVCKAFSIHATRAYGVEDAFVFNEESDKLDKYIQRYYEEIDRFKINHDMSHDKLVNKSKRAAAFIIISEDIDLLSDLFFIKKLPHSGFSDFFYAHFVFSLCCAFLDIDRINVPKDVERDLIHNLLKERGKSSFAWLMLTMRAFADAYGEKVEPASGDDEA